MGRLNNGNSTSEQYCDHPIVVLNAVNPDICR
jgi:hypothetical protein